MVSLHADDAIAISVVAYFYPLIITDEQFTAEGITVDMKMRATMTCHRSLIFLGDLGM